MTKNEIVGRLKAGGLDASSTNRSAAVYVADAMAGRAVPGWFAYRIVCDSEATERSARAILSLWYDIDANGDVWRLRSKNRVPLMAIKRGGVPPAPPTPTGDYMYFEAQEANSAVSMTSTLTTAPNLEYSTDGDNWQEWQHTTSDGTHTFDTLTLTEVGDRVYLRGDNPNGLAFMPEGAEMPNFSNFTLTGKVNAGGNIMSLLDTIMMLTVVPQFGFMFLFAAFDDSCLITPPNMDIITTIGFAGCNRMFSGQQLLAYAADMPMLTNIDYGGCDSMYMYCSGITSAADMSSLTNIAEGGCHEMYSGDTSLTSAASMPVLTTIGDFGCNQMYEDCTSLTSAADMSALTSIGYAGCVSMYSNCTFNMSDDGTTLNFAFPTPPITTTGDDPQTYATAYDVADWMGNTNGFTNP